MFLTYVSGVFSYARIENTDANMGNNLVLAWGKVLVTFGYTDSGQNPPTYDPTTASKITCDISAVTCRPL